MRNVNYILLHHPPRKLYILFQVHHIFLSGYQTLLTNVGEFLALHFCDTRIVYADSKDSLIQALAGFVCHKATLTALENMPLQRLVKFSYR